ncbi:MAG: NAD(P)-dependent oxidoreductase [Gammaproteobacteria bacterium]|nr:NAD(P)-dependent oxidoreductase [Gammaproteobacteria bacterium]
MRVAVTGATGIVGQFVVGRLLREGCRVAALARAGTDRSICPGDVEWIGGDLGDQAALDALVGGADGLVHCAFQHLPGRYRGGEGDDVPGFWRINLGGTIDLLEAAAGAGVARTVLMSSRAVFGLPVEGPIGDAHRTAATTHYGAMKAATEALAGVYRDVVALRPTGVYGVVRPLTRTKWLGLAEDVAAGRPVGVSRSGTEVHGEDVADAAWRLLTAPSATVAGRVFNCSDIAVETRVIVHRMRAALGRPGPLPAAALPAGNVLRCDGLHALGWRPGGDARLQEEIDALCALVRERGAGPVSDGR